MQKTSVRALLADIQMAVSEHRVNEQYYQLQQRFKQQGVSTYALHVLINAALAQQDKQVASVDNNLQYYQAADNQQQEIERLKAEVERLKAAKWQHKI